MATKITETTELNIYLANEDQTATRTIKIDNPVTMPLPSLDNIKTALAPAFANMAADGSGEPVYFFYDDGNQGGYDEAMTQVTGAEIITITKEVREIV